jgi:hypothetical protein
VGCKWWVYLIYCNITPGLCTVTSAHPQSSPSYIRTQLPPPSRREQSIVLRKICNKSLFPSSERERKASLEVEVEVEVDVQNRPHHQPSSSSPPLLQELPSEGTVRVPDRCATNLRLSVFDPLRGVVLGAGCPEKGKEGKGRGGFGSFCPQPERYKKPRLRKRRAGAGVFALA